MSETTDLQTELAAARAELLAALDGVTQEEFARRPPGPVTDDEARWPIREVLWHVGVYEDWTRRSIAQGLDGRPVAAYEARQRPAHLNTPALLLEWLEQSRRPTEVQLRRLDDADLDREFEVPGRGPRRPRAMLGGLARHDRGHAEQVRALRSLPPTEER